MCEHFLVFLRWQVGKSDKRRIVVDVREFMSSLPAVLHQSNMDIVPVTLEVGMRPSAQDPSCCTKAETVALS